MMTDEIVVERCLMGGCVSEDKHAEVRFTLRLLKW